MVQYRLVTQLVIKSLDTNYRNVIITVIKAVAKLAEGDIFLFVAHVLIQHNLPVYSLHTLYLPEHMDQKDERWCTQRCPA